MNTWKRLSIVTLTLLTACAPPRPAEQEPTNKVIPIEQRKSEISTVSSWEIRGALAAKTTNKGWTASMNWTQRGASNYQIRLMGPLGGGSVLISRNGGAVTLQDGSKVSTSSNADELLFKQTGIHLPVNHLYYWVRGLPAPGQVNGEKHDKYNHLVELKQNGYTISFTKYTSMKGIDLPSTIRLDGNGVMIKVIIKKWMV